MLADPRILILDEATSNLDTESEALIQKSLNELVTVSYTHLRAHETVLDLVCRLLLEKKNSYLCSSTISNSSHNVHSLKYHN